MRRFWGPIPLAAVLPILLAGGCARRVHVSTLPVASDPMPETFGESAPNPAPPSAAPEPCPPGDRYVMVNGKCVDLEGK